jgi:hypothetical protein
LYEHSSVPKEHLPQLTSDNPLVGKKHAPLQRSRTEYPSHQLELVYLPDDVRIAFLWRFCHGASEKAKKIDILVINRAIISSLFFQGHMIKNSYLFDYFSRFGFIA